MEVNEADYSSDLVHCSAGGRRGVGVGVRRWSCSTHTGDVVVWTVWQNGCEGVVCILAMLTPGLECVSLRHRMMLWV